MTDDAITVGVVVVRRALKGPWASHAWSPAQVLPAAPDLAPWTSLGGLPERQSFYAGPATLELARSETGHYRDNLAMAQPSLWVALRPIAGEEVELGLVTADPYEGEALAETLGELVEAVPMPAEIRERISAFVAAHHVERPFFKRKRDRLKPGSGRPGQGGADWDAGS